MVSAGSAPREAVRAVEARLPPQAARMRISTPADCSGWQRAGCPPCRCSAGHRGAERLEALTARRAAREPLQYLCGSWSFLDFELAVGPGVLCPRADTEVVAEAAANTLAGVAAPRVLDLCAGTGCLGLGVKRFCPAAQVTCVEKSFIWKRTAAAP